MLKAIKLYFTTPLHLSIGRGDFYDHCSDMLHSDTIKSAIISVAIESGIIKEKEILDTLRNFKISSAFPFNNEELFFPKPYIHLPITITGIEPHLISKKIKNVRFISKTIFERVINGDANIELSIDQIKNSQYISESGLSKGEPFIETSTQQRVAIPLDRSEDTKPYYIERLFFREGSGLFFIIECDGSQDILYFINTALNILRDSGLGTDRTVGNGLFNLEITDLEIKVSSESQYMTNLSLYCPANDELDDEALNRSSYSLIKRGGYIAGSSQKKFRHFRKKSIFMFQEGSVFPSNIKLKGKVIDLKPDTTPELHPVYRDGTSIFLPLNIDNNG